jgi:ferrous iron transport protein B
MRILLLGNPNVGKSAVFSRLTGVHVITSNYPGTTVEFTKGSMRMPQELGFAGEMVEIFDVPGIYTLEPVSKAEEVVIKMLEEGDIIINVVNAINLERSLNLTLQLLKKKIPIVVALNFWDEAEHTGIKIDIDKLENILGVPCVPTCAITGEGFKELVRRIKEAKAGEYEYDEEERWHEVGNIINEVERVIHRHHRFRERLADASIVPETGILIALIVLTGMVYIIRFVGEMLISCILEPFFERIWTPVILQLSSMLNNQGLLHAILIGEVKGNNIHFETAFGLLTTGLFIPFGIVLPYVVAFYLVLALLEDSGYLPRLAILVDNVMHRLGLHGMAIIPMMLGVGCNVPGILSTRIMETDRERFIAITLMSIAVPCMAQIAMIFGLIARYGVYGLCIVFGSLFMVWIILGIFLNKNIKGESMEIFLEIPPYRMPYIPGIIKKLWMRIIWFIKEAVPWVLIGVLVGNILYNTGIINIIAKYTAPVISSIWGLPKEAIGALILGFLRKDIAIGMLIPLELTLPQLIVASVILTMYFPCIATFATLIKELGITAMIKSTIIMITSTLLVGGILNLIL